MSGAAWREPLSVILEQGPLARRIRRAAADCSQARMQPVFAALCNCLEQGRMFTELD